MNDRKLVLYLDTSVIGGYYDDEFFVDTQRLFHEIKTGKYNIVIYEDEKI